MARFDAVVVGGGPAGCRAGSLIARRGFRVAILEEHGEVGRPSCCAGVVGSRGMRELGIDVSPHVLSELRRAVIHSPSGRSVEIGRGRVEALVIDRAGFDRELGAEAVDSGARLLTGTRCTGLSSGRNIRVKASGRHGGILKADLVIGADGAASSVARSTGLVGRDAGYVMCAQAELRGEHEEDAAEIFLGSRYAPGFFGWKVGAGGLCRIGTGTVAGSPIEHLRRLIRENPALRGRVRVPGRIPMAVRPIPSFFLRRPQSGRVMLVGDAAGQVKPLTGGGLYLGLMCAAFAAETAVRWFEGKEDLSGYGRRILDAVGREILLGEMARRIFRGLSDEELESAVLSLEGKLGRVVVESFDFDRHSGVILGVLRNLPALLSGFGMRRALSITRKILAK